MSRKPTDYVSDTHIADWLERHGVEPTVRARSILISTLVHGIALSSDVDAARHHFVSMLFGEIDIELPPNARWWPDHYPPPTIRSSAPESLDNWPDATTESGQRTHSHGGQDTNTP